VFLNRLVFKALNSFESNEFNLQSQTSSSIPSNSPQAITNTPAPAQRGFLDPFQQPANAAQFQNAQGFSVNGGQFTSSSTRGGDVVNHVTIHGQLNFVSCSPVDDTRTTSMTPSIPKDYGYSERRMHPGRLHGAVRVSRC